MVNKSDYIKNVIGKGDKGSGLLNYKCAPTLENNDQVTVVDDGMDGIAVLDVPEGHFAVVHSTGGSRNTKTAAGHARSMAERLLKQANLIGSYPMAFANVIDSRTGDESMLEAMADGMIAVAGDNGLAIMNGENAILGDRVVVDANISGTMVGIIEKDKFRAMGDSVLALDDDNFIVEMGGTTYAVFDPKGLKLFMNSDGVGTKTALYELARAYARAVRDSIAMKLDDTAKFGARARVISDVCETRGPIPFDLINAEMRNWAREHGMLGIMQREMVGRRIQGYKNNPAYNISGSVVSTIDEERLRNPLRPSAGEYLVVLAALDPNPRSNGITAKRKGAAALGGPDWHRTPQGKWLLEYLTRPSTVLYPHFMDMVDKGLATSVYHMSGGAYKGKLARPLAKQDLFVKLGNLFEPDPRELALAGVTLTSAEDAYQMFPMGNDGLAATLDPEALIKEAEARGLRARTVGRLEKAVNGRTGVELEACNGDTVYYSGKKEAA